MTSILLSVICLDIFREYATRLSDINSYQFGRIVMGNSIESTVKVPIMGMDIKIPLSFALVIG